MSLFKLSNTKPSFDPVQRAKEILGKVPSSHLIKEAYLFGSAVTGGFTEDSDLDIIVTVGNSVDCKTLQTEVYKAGFSDIAIDWIFKVDDEFQSRKDVGGVCFEAFHYGKKLV